tara:strand:+ start:2119 stop:2451 length:333 start_codon:yes stop_codon:yes gene_type:complete
MATRIYYRLSDDANNGHSLWSGAITVNGSPKKQEARQAVARHLQCERLPARTLVITENELKHGTWTADEIRGATTPMADAPTVKRKKKAFEDVGMSFDQAEDLLKKFGLK